MSKEIWAGRIEQIGLGHKEKTILGIKLNESADLLMLSNRRLNLWIFSIFNGYRQLGTFEVQRPHNFKEGDNVLVYVSDNKIIKVIKDG